jgi:hypothetical protein
VHVAGLVRKFCRGFVIAFVRHDIPPGFSTQRVVPGRSYSDQSELSTSFFTRSQYASMSNLRSRPLAFI